MRKRKKVALVNQRYGLEVNGGSEYYTRQLAEHLSSEYDVEVLTTKSLDYHLWDNYYTDDVEIINNVAVIRFPIKRSKNQKHLERLDRLVRRRYLGKSIVAKLWINEFGPLCPDLVRYIKRHASDYAAFIFVTYMYYPAIKGIPLVSEKAILLPTAHDDPYIFLPHYRQVFDNAHSLGYLTEEEESLVEQFQDVKRKPHCIVGCGVDLPESIDNKAFREKYGISGDYIVYIGRIGPEKGCDKMLAAFQKYCEVYDTKELKLVLMGRGEIDIPPNLPVVQLGFVSEQDKFDGLSGASALWLPSQFESLSIAVLEALSLGVPVLVNGECEVLKGHCEKSAAGWFYVGVDDAVEQIRAIATIQDRKEVSDNARRYINERYTWDITISRITQLIDGLN